jgi:hypothetical protein
MRVTNGIALRCSLLLTVTIVNYVATLKAEQLLTATLTLTRTLTMNSVATLKAHNGRATVTCMSVSVSCGKTLLRG